jgi:hypothetical protein
MLPDLGHVEFANFPVTEIDFEDAVHVCSPQCDLVSYQTFADVALMPLNHDVTVASHFQDSVVREIFYGGEDPRKLSPTASVPMHRRFVIQGPMWPDMVVDFTPVIESGLAIGNRLEPAPANHFQFQRSMKPFVLALGLGMVWPAVSNPDPKSN